MVGRDWYQNKSDRREGNKGSESSSHAKQLRRMPSLQSTFALLAVCHATATVTDRASAAVHMCTDMGMGTAEIADGLGCSQRRVQQLLTANGV